MTRINLEDLFYFSYKEYVYSLYGVMVWMGVYWIACIE